MDEKKWVAYLVRCSDNSLYCGTSNDIKSRLIEHNSARGARYTRSRRPVELVAIGPEMTKSEALKLEYRIKQLPAKKRTIKPTATGQVLKIIKKSKKGVDGPTLVKKTGFNDKKIQNILHRTYKQGKIKRVDRGKYVGA
jgi:putative endonuclease